MTCLEDLGDKLKPMDFFFSIFFFSCTAVCGMGHMKIENCVLGTGHTVSG